MLEMTLDQEPTEEMKDARQQSEQVRRMNRMTTTTTVCHNYIIHKGQLKL